MTKLSLLLKVLENETEETINKQLRLFQERALPDLSNNIKCGNSLIGWDIKQNLQIELFDAEKQYKINPFDWKDGFPKVFKNGGFDVVIGNPPYVVLGSDYEALDYFKSKYSVAHGGKVNLYKLFIEKAINLLKEKGWFGFICPSNYLSSADSFELRKMIIDKTALYEIIEYTEKDRVFQGVTQALTTIVFQKLSAPFQSFSLVTSKHGKNIGSQKDFLKNDSLEFIFCNDLINKMRSLKIRFSDIADGYQGEINVSIHKELFSNSPKINSLPLLRGNLIGPYQLLDKTREFCPISADKREHYKIERIAFQEVSNQQQHRRVRAVPIDQNILCGHTTNYCFAKDKRYNLLYLAGLLNSKLINYYFSYFNNTNHVPIGEIMNIPSPPINFSNPSEKARHDQIISLVDRMIALNKNLPSAKTPDDRVRLERELKATDDEIDRLVYQLYGLTDEEIAIVEEKA